jgi:hypothetical protein
MQQVEPPESGRSRSEKASMHPKSILSISCDASEKLRIEHPSGGWVSANKTATKTYHVISGMGNFPCSSYTIDNIKLICQCDAVVEHCVDYVIAFLLVLGSNPAENLFNFDFMQYCSRLKVLSAASLVRG